MLDLPLKGLDFGMQPPLSGVACSSNGSSKTSCPVEKVAARTVRIMGQLRMDTGFKLCAWDSL